MSTKSSTVEVKIGTSVIKNFERINFKWSDVYAEFIDNSLQSYLDHRQELDKINGNKHCYIEFSTSDGKLSILDNAYGMNEEEFKRALVFNSHPADRDISKSLGRYGIGLKRAAQHLGRKCLIKSTAYGSNLKYSAVLDFDAFAEDKDKIEFKIDDDAPLEEHWTLIEITELRNAGLTTKERTDLQSDLERIYSGFLENQDLIVVIDKKRYQAFSPSLLKDENSLDTSILISAAFEYDGKQYSYSGWAGILEKMSDRDAGLDIRKNNRAIKLRYSPEKLFGNSSDYRRRRITGQFNITGGDWAESIDKTGFAMSDAFWEKFNGSLLSNPKFVRLCKQAKELRTKVNKVTEKPTLKASIFGVKDPRKQTTAAISAESENAPKVGETSSSKESAALGKTENNPDNSAQTVSSPARPNETPNSVAANSSNGLDIDHYDEEAIYEYPLDNGSKVSVFLKINWEPETNVDAPMIFTTKEDGIHATLNLFHPVFKSISRDNKAKELLQLITVSIAAAKKLTDNSVSEAERKVLNTFLAKLCDVLQKASGNGK